MEQKAISSNLVTKDFFKKELKRELNDTIDRLLQGIRREITFSAELIEEKLERNLTKHTSLILTTVDPLLKELETRQQDRILGAEQLRRATEKIDNHEKRIKKLEQVRQVA